MKISWKGWGKPRKTSVRIVDVLAEIRNKYLLNISEEHYGSANPLGFKFIQNNKKN
jgi:hypothetical protein